MRNAWIFLLGALVLLPAPGGASQGQSIEAGGNQGGTVPPAELQVRTEPRLQGISSGAQLRCGKPVIRWAPVAGAERYRLQISGDPGFAAILDQADVRTADWTPAALAVGSYHLRARSLAADGYEGDWSESIGFSVLPPYPAPVLEKPGRDSGRVRFRWSDRGPGVVYRLHVAKDEDFQTIFHEEIASGTETLLTEPAESGLYYTRIKAFDGDGCESGFSNVRKFRVGGFWRTVCKPCVLGPLAVLIYLLAR